MVQGRVVLIPTPPHLFETILIPVPFKKLNRTKWTDEYNKFSYMPRLTFFEFKFFFKLLLKFLIILK